MDLAINLHQFSFQISWITLLAYRLAELYWNWRNICRLVQIGWVGRCMNAEQCCRQFLLLHAQWRRRSLSISHPYVKPWSKRRAHVNVWISPFPLSLCYSSRNVKEASITGAYNLQVSPHNKWLYLSTAFLVAFSSKSSKKISGKLLIWTANLIWIICNRAPPG